MPTKTPEPKAPKAEKPADAAAPVTGSAKVKRPNLRGWKIIPAADVVESDTVLARYP